MNIELIEKELQSADSLLQNYTNNVTVFGSARTNQDDILSSQARELGKLLSDSGFNILTGGGPGIMESVNRGAFEGKSSSIGLNITLDHEQFPNPYLDEVITFEHFFTRKYALINYSVACIYFPGGFGTGDELLEVLTLIQTKKIRPIKVFLYGTEFWKHLVDWFKDLDNINFVNGNYLDSLYVVDDIHKIVKILQE